MSCKSYISLIPKPSSTSILPSQFFPFFLSLPFLPFSTKIFSHFSTLLSRLRQIPHVSHRILASSFHLFLFLLPSFPSHLPSSHFFFNFFNFLIFSTLPFSSLSLSLLFFSPPSFSNFPLLVYLSLISPFLFSLGSFFFSFIASINLLCLTSTSCNYLSPSQYFLCLFSPPSLTYVFISFPAILFPCFQPPLLFAFNPLFSPLHPFLNPLSLFCLLFVLLSLFISSSSFSHFLLTITTTISCPWCSRYRRRK